MLPKFGRRANAKDGGDVAASSSRPSDEVVQVDKLRTLDDGVSGEQAHDEAGGQASKDMELLVKRVADAPVGYTTTMPKLAELDISNLWNDFLQVINQDFDMSVLTACLAQHLDDEDVPWNPDMLLVQLTSDMLDAAGATEAGAPAPDRDALAAAGEARRRRKVLLEEADEAYDRAQGSSRRPGPRAGNQAGDADPQGRGPPRRAERRRDESLERGGLRGEASNEAHKSDKRVTASNWVSASQKSSSPPRNVRPSDAAAKKNKRAGV